MSSDNNVQQREQLSNLSNLESGMDSKTCRICFDSEEEDLIKACKCSGTLGYVHRKCLSHWISERFVNLHDSYCEICTTRFIVRTRSFRKWVPIKNDIERKKYYRKIAVILFFLTVLCVFEGVVCSEFLDFNHKTILSAFLIIIFLVPIFLLTGILIKVVVSKHLVQKTDATISEYQEI